MYPNLVISLSNTKAQAFASIPDVFARSEKTKPGSLGVYKFESYGPDTARFKTYEGATT